MGLLFYAEATSPRFREEIARSASFGSEAQEFPHFGSPDIGSTSCLESHRNDEVTKGKRKGGEMRREKEGKQGEMRREKEGKRGEMRREKEGKRLQLQLGLQLFNLLPPLQKLN